ncbi:MAG: hypothetical protein KAJ03_05085 [Gammaproteobacteria bacterium]|nr:hypothetical protein [Gammaproteobacteria bacterium]
MADQKKKYYFLSYRQKRFSWGWESAVRVHRCLDVHPLAWLSKQYNYPGGDPSNNCDMYEITFWKEITKEEYEEHEKIWEECKENVHPTKKTAQNKPILSRAD